MANVTFSVDGPTQALTGSSADDLITVNDMGNDGTTVAHTINGGAGSDTVVFDGTLGTTFDAIATGFEVAGGGDDSITATATEFFEFDNGTVTFGAGVNPEFLSESALTQNAPGAQWAVDDLLEYDGGSVGSQGDVWSLATANGAALTTTSTVTILDGTTVLGTLTTDGNDLFFTADNAFRSSLNIGETSNVSFEVVLESDAGGSFTETFTAVVTGVATAGADTFTGTDEDDTASLLAGADYAVGKDGDDDIYGGAGNDTIYAGANDAGDDTLIGNADDDVLAGGAGDDLLVGNSVRATNVTNGTAASDEGTNALYGGAGDDVIVIGGFDDGNGATATLVYDNGTGTDLESRGTAATAAEATGAEGGEAFGGAGDDYIIGTLTGHDMVGMGDGDDTVVLGAGNDTVYAGSDDTGADVVAAGNGDNTVYTGAGDDTITATNGGDLIGAGAGNDDINAGDGDNTVFGGEGNDDITAGSGADDLFGGAGDDTIDAGTGNDMIFGGAGDDEITAGTGLDTIDAGAGDDLIILGGGAEADAIIFTAGNDEITGFISGDDTIDVSALGITNFDTAIIVSDVNSTTITFDDEIGRAHV